MRHSEQVLLVHMTEPDSLDVLAREGFAVDAVREVIPTDVIRRMLAWSIDRFFADGRLVAPSREAIVAAWGDKLEELGIEMPDTEIETDSIGFVIDDLRSNHARIMAEKWTTDFASEIAKADSGDRVEIFNQYAASMYTTAQGLASKRNEADGYAGIDDSVRRLIQRIDEGQSTRGMTFGIPELDAHMFGVHPGEICVVCAESGVGKSWFGGYTLLSEWRAGRRAVMVTLENNTEMTYDRLACMATGIDYGEYQRGRVNDDDLRKLFTLLDQMEASEHRPIITQLAPDLRTPSGVVRKAVLEDADSLIVDQLSFMRPEATSKATQRNFQVNEIMHDLKELIDQGTGRKIPLLLFVQINRDGAAAARKMGRYLKQHLAESSGVEQTADFLWAIYQTSEQRSNDIAELQCLKARRVPDKHFETLWSPQIGSILVRREIDLLARERAAA